MQSYSYHIEKDIYIVESNVSYLIYMEGSCKNKPLMLVGANIALMFDDVIDFSI